MVTVIGSFNTFTCSSRIQPMNGKISAVTQVHSEDETSGPAAKAVAIQPPSGEPDACHVTSKQHSDSTISSQVAQGGMFAGVGEFPPTPVERTASASQLPLHYREDATLRCAVGCFL